MITIKMIIGSPSSIKHWEFTYRVIGCFNSITSKPNNVSDSCEIHSRSDGRMCSVEGEDGMVEVWPAVAEHAPRVSIRDDCVKMEGVSDDSLVVVVGMLDKGSGVVGNEGGPVE